MSLIIDGNKGNKNNDMSSDIISDSLSGINKELTTTKSNLLITASYSLSLNQKRLIETAIAKIKWEDGVPNEILITADEYADAWGISQNSGYEALKKAANELIRESLILPKMSNGEVWEINWLSKKAYADRRGYVKIVFTEDLKPYLQNLNKGYYTNLRLTELRPYKSLSSMRLHEILMQFKETGFRSLSVESLRDFFRMKDKYPKFADFRRYVLERSRQDVEKHSGYEIKITPVKKGGKYYLVNFTFTRKFDRKIL